jgi:hypothetical protein
VLSIALNRDCGCELGYQIASGDEVISSEVSSILLDDRRDYERLRNRDCDIVLLSEIEAVGDDICESRVSLWGAASVVVSWQPDERISERGLECLKCFDLPRQLVISVPNAAAI